MQTTPVGGMYIRFDVDTGRSVYLGADFQELQVLSSPIWGSDPLEFYKWEAMNHNWSLYNPDPDLQMDEGL
jgi:hypothetical protein